jgi:hypothetical protein
MSMLDDVLDYYEDVAAADRIGADSKAGSEAKAGRRN